MSASAAFWFSALINILRFCNQAEACPRGAKELPIPSPIRPRLPFNVLILVATGSVTLPANLTRKRLSRAGVLR